MASTPVITSPADNSTQSLPFDLVGTGTVNSIVEVRDDAGFLLPATANPVTVDGAGDWTIHVTSLTGTGTGNKWYAAAGGTVDEVAAGVTIEYSGQTAIANATTGTNSGVSYNSGDIIVVAISVRHANQVTGVTVGGHAATLRNRIRGWTGATQVTTPVYIYSWAADATESGDVVVTMEGSTSSVYFWTYVTRGGSSVAPTTPAFNVDTAPSGGRAATNGQTGTAVQDTILALSTANSVRPAAGSIIIGVECTFTGTWTNGTMGGAARTAYSSDTVVDGSVDLSDWAPRSSFFHSVACSGSADYTIGTTSTDGSVHYNLIVLEVAV